MSENSWVLRGVDPETRDKAVEEAARLGMDLADYLTDIVLRSTLTEQMGPLADAPVTSAAEAQGDFAVRHRLKAIERRLESAVGGFDGALFDMNDRVGDLEVLAGDTVQGLRQAAAETSGQFAAVQLYVADLEEKANARADAADISHAALKDACLGLNHRIDDVETVARRADTSANVLADAHEALKHAVADDFSAFTLETNERLHHGLREVRDAADSAAEQADAAVAHLVVELRAVRVSLEQSVAEGVAETRSRMHAAFADAAERMGNLADRIVDNERLAQRTAEQLRAQIVDVEDGAQTALEETAETLRQANAAIANDLTRAIAATRSDATAALSELREDHAMLAARLKLTDVALGATADDVVALRQAADDAAQGIRAATAAYADVRQGINAAQTLSDQRFDALIERVATGERDSADIRHQLRADADRIEACTFASLEKLARDIATGDAALDIKLAESIIATRQNADAAEGRAEAALAVVRATSAEALEQIRQQQASQAAQLEEQHTGVVARLRLVEGALVDAGSAVSPLRDSVAKLEAFAADRSTERDIVTRLTNLERATRYAETEGAINILRQHVDALAAIVGDGRDDTALVRRIEELQARLAENDTHTGETTERLHDVARMLGRVTAQHAEAAAYTDQRIGRLEQAIHDVRAEIPAPQTNVANGDEVIALSLRLTAVERAQAEVPHANAADADEMLVFGQRLAAMERRQAEGLETLRADIARFIEDNDQRLEVLETGPEAVNSDLAAQFADLRRRIEERILGVELRSVRTLEQVAETVAILEQRFSGIDGDLEAKTA